MKEKGFFPLTSLGYRSEKGLTDKQEQQLQL